MEHYTFISTDFFEVNESTKEICFISFEDSIVNLFGKILYQDQSEFDNVLDLIKKFDSDRKEFILNKEYDPLLEYEKYKNKDKDKAVDLASLGLEIINKFIEAKDNNLAIVELIENEFNSINDPDFLFKSWSFRLISAKRVFEIL
jgi:hypothetical protein